MIFVGSFTTGTRESTMIVTVDMMSDLELELEEISSEYLIEGKKWLRLTT
jgi:hypothetical protein